MHAPVRDPQDTDKLKYLNAVAAQTPGTLTYFRADLLEEGSYAEAMQGCGIVFHTASPFVMNVADPQKELIEPGINPRGTSESFNLIRQLGDGTMKSGAPMWGMGVVDVRDLAEAHFRAAFTPAASGHYIISGHNTDFLAMATALAKHFGSAFAFPKRTLPKWLVGLVGPLANPGMTRKMISRNVNYPWRADHSKNVRELGMTYPPMEKSIVDFFQQMVDAGSVTPSK